jgi:uncharacterized membrane protein YsdA (DUF1294 family)
MGKIEKKLKMAYIKLIFFKVYEYDCKNDENQRYRVSEVFR